MRSILSPCPALSLTFALLSRTLSVQAQSNYFLAPVGGAVITAGEAYTIKWRPTTPGPVFLQLSYNNDAIAGNLTSSTSNTGSYSWTPDNVLAGFNGGSNYFLVICDVAIGGCSYTPNGRFNVVAATGVTTTSASFDLEPLTSNLLSTSLVPTNPSFTLVTSSAPSSLNLSPTASTSRNTALTSPTTRSTSPTISTPSTGPSPLFSSSSSPSSSPSSSSSSSGGLATWAKVVIGVVVPIAVLLSIALVAYIVRLRRQARHVHQPLLPPHLPPPPQHGEMQQHWSGYDRKAELESDGNRVELPSREPQRIRVHELGG